MFKRLEQRNREIWEGHSRILEDATHVIGGIGVGMLLYPALRRQAKPLAYSLLLLSTALHAYADIVNPSRSTSDGRFRGFAEEDLS